MEIICYSCGRGEYPENTLEAIRHCQSINPDWRIEMDVQLTSDRQLVLFHDQNTLRTTGKDLQIAELTLEKVLELNAGHNFKRDNDYVFRESSLKIPLLKEVLLEFPKAKLLLDIHTKNPEVIEVFLQLMETCFADGNFIVASAHDEIIHELRKKKPHWKFGVPAKEAKKMLYSSFVYLDGLFPIQSDVLLLPKKYGNINVLSNRVLRHARKRKRPIWAWAFEGAHVETINSKKEMEELKDMGVQGIFTEYPEKLAKEL